MTKRSFTLIELLIVISIIGILATIALSVNTIVRRKAFDARAKSEVQVLLKSWITYSGDGGNLVDQCSGTSVLDTANLVGSPSVTEDLISARALGSSFDSTGIHAATFPAIICTYPASTNSAAALAVGKQLLMNPSPDPANRIYATGSTGQAIDELFDTPAIGTNPWFVAVQK